MSKGDFTADTFIQLLKVESKLNSDLMLKSNFINYYRQL